MVRIILGRFNSLFQKLWRKNKIFSSTITV